jgi:hypothetical protein
MSFGGKNMKRRREKRGKCKRKRKKEERKRKAYSGLPLDGLPSEMELHCGLSSEARQRGQNTKISF